MHYFSGANKTRRSPCPNNTLRVAADDPRNQPNTHSSEPSSSAATKGNDKNHARPRQTTPLLPNETPMMRCSFCTMHSMPRRWPMTCLKRDKQPPERKGIRKAMSIEAPRLPLQVSQMQPPKSQRPKNQSKDSNTSSKSCLAPKSRSNPSPKHRLQSSWAILPCPPDHRAPLPPPLLPYPSPRPIVHPHH